jgi:hypothetical protein
MFEGVIATSYNQGDKFFIDPMKLLPLSRFLPQPKYDLELTVAFSFLCLVGLDYGSIPDNIINCYFFSFSELTMFNCLFKH